MPPSSQKPTRRPSHSKPRPRPKPGSRGPSRRRRSSRREIANRPAPRHSFPPATRDRDAPPVPFPLTGRPQALACRLSIPPRCSTTSLLCASQFDMDKLGKPEEEDVINDKPMPLLDHLIELRTRLLWSMAAFMVTFFVCYYFKQAIFSLPRRAAGAHPGSARRRTEDDLHLADRAVLHLFEGGDVRRAVLRLSGHRDAALAVRRARPVSQRETRDPAVPGGDAGAVPDGRGARLLLRVSGRLELLPRFREPHRRRRHADRGAASHQRISRSRDEAGAARSALPSSFRWGCR